MLYISISKIIFSTLQKVGVTDGWSPHSREQTRVNLPGQLGSSMEMLIKIKVGVCRTGIDNVKTAPWGQKE